uniref:Putative secreted protein n=1 Tax=Anopheles triannulatus TaxID=58253 RepID=A0A2M4B0H8_9DIPT
MPWRTVFGFFAGGSSLPAALASAAAFRRCAFTIGFSGRYFSSSLSSCWAVGLSRACENWLIGGGTFRRFCRIAFWRWMRMYFGQRTNRDRSRFGCTFWPMP